MRDPRRLAEPVRVVVPSQSLRLHVAGALVRRAGRAVLGVAVQTLYGVAREILERAGEPAPSGAGLFPIAVRQAARAERALRDDLDGLLDGYAPVAATVADLLDAGLEREDLPRLERLLVGSAPERERARALLRVAVATRARLREHGVAREADAFARARTVLERDRRALPARAVLVHGFAEATGAATGLLEVLLRGPDAALFLDHPPDPADPSRVEAGAAFTRRLAERLAPAGGTPVAAARPDPPELAALVAPSAEAEVRGVAERVARLLDAGVRAEGIALVARSLEPYAVPIRTHFGRLGVPYSGLDARGPSGPEGRRVRALLDLLRRGPQAPTDSWLDALGVERIDGVPLPDLRVALHALGAGRVADVAALSLAVALGDDAWLALPVRRGLESTGDARAGDDDEGRAVVAARRRVPRTALESRVASAGRLVERFARFGHRELAGHLDEFRGLTSELGFAPDDLAAQALERAFDGLPPRFRLDADDFAVLALRALGDVGTTPLGGEGGGVAVLDVTEARGRSFDALFLLGLNRDVFPRAIREDPLLPDALRRELLPALPDLPVKQLGFSEERYLFAQLVASSPRVTLSWRSTDDADRALPPSPLVERLDLDAPARLPRLYAPPQPPEQERLAAPRPAREHAVLAALFAGRGELAAVLPCAIEEVSPAAEDPEQDARAQLAVLDELDPDRRTAAGRRRASQLGPYFGFVGGPLPGAPDPRSRALYVTTIEGMARCPWQTFVERLLGIEPTPDALEALPGLDPLLVGRVVHAVLEELAGERDAEVELQSALEYLPRRVEWPEAEELGRLVLEVSRRELRAVGAPLPGFARALAARVLPYLEAVRTADWSDGGVVVVGVELAGTAELTIDGRVRRLHFVADRADIAGGVLRLTDYKTGKPAGIDARKPETRRENLMRQIAEGRRLQAAIYARAAGVRAAEGRYLFAHPDAPEHARVAAVSADDPALAPALEGAVRAALDAWDRGVFFPRLFDARSGQDSAVCRWCRVAEACVRRDVARERRLRGWLRRQTDGEGELVDAKAEIEALRALWTLPLRARDPA